MREDRRAHGYEGAGGEAVEHAEDDDGRVAARGEPEGQHDDGAEEGGEDHGVVAPDSVGEDAGEDAAEDGGRVEDGD